jgi:site-specific DNA-cytosine methylase
MYEFTSLFPFCGLGAGARGVLQAIATLGTDQARFKCLGGIDNDPEGCSDFERLTGGPALLADLHDLTPADLRRFLETHHGPAAARRRPDFLFSSPPCKGFSRLMGKAKAETAHYQRLNELVPKGIFLALETYQERIPVIVIENVPGILQRGAHLLERVTSMLHSYGYVIDRATHDCGEIGGLAQHRRRFLLIARDPKQVPAYVYQPLRRRVKGCGEVLQELPFPGDEELGGLLHRLPLIDWLTWVRLALIPPGGDWRDLPTREQLLRAIGANAGEGGEVRLGQNPDAHRNKLAVKGWSDPAATVIGASRPGSGAGCVADPLDPALQEAWSRRGEKAPGTRTWFNGKYHLDTWGDPTRAVIGGPGNGAEFVADPVQADAIQTEPMFHGAFGIQVWEDPAKCVRGAATVRTAPAAVAEPVMLDHEPRRGALGVMDSAAPANTVRGRSDVRTGPAAVADPLALGKTADNADSFKGRPGLLGVLDAAEPANAVTAGMAVASSNTPAAVAEPLQVNIGDPSRGGALGVLDPGEPAPTITGNVAVTGSNTPGSIADPRPFDSGRMGVTRWSDPSRAVIGESYPSNGGASVADPRLLFTPLAPGQARREKLGRFQVLDWRNPASSITGPGTNGAYGVADVRLGCAPRAGTYGVLSWEQAAMTIIGQARIDSGTFAVADPRPAALPLGWTPPKGTIPIILSRWGCWHRPLTTLELAVLQSIPPTLGGRPLELAGNSVARKRERIGNAVPVLAGEAIGRSVLKALLASAVGHWSILFSDDGSAVWVRDDGRTELQVGPAEEEVVYAA